MSIAAFATACVPSAPAGPPTDPELAFHYAPIIYQDTDDTDTEADFITAFDYDGNDIGSDNWEHLDQFRGRLRAVVYYSVVEGVHHWYIVYAFFHPRDWNDATVSTDTEHENDLEGTLAIVRKGAPFGRLQAMITVAHTNFYSWTPEGSLASDGVEDIDGELRMDSVGGLPHPMLSVEPKGHGVKAYPEAGDFDGSPGQDGVIYTPDRSPTDAETIPGPASQDRKEARYRLVNLFAGLWIEQLHESLNGSIGLPTYDHFGTFDGNDTDADSCGDAILVSCDEDAANLPWGWDDSGDAPVRNTSGPFPPFISTVYPGELALDPAHVTDVYFDGLAIDSSYRRNQYLRDLKDSLFGPSHLPDGWPEGLDISALFAKI